MKKTKFYDFNKIKDYVTLNKHCTFILRPRNYSKSLLLLEEQIKIYEELENEQKRN